MNLGGLHGMFTRWMPMMLPGLSMPGRIRRRCGLNTLRNSRGFTLWITWKRPLAHHQRVRPRMRSIQRRNAEMIRPRRRRNPLRKLRKPLLPIDIRVPKIVPRISLLRIFRQAVVGTNNNGWRRHVREVDRQRGR